MRLTSSPKPLLTLFFSVRTIATESTQLTTTPSLGRVNPEHLLRVCTILYQQQNSPDPKLHSSLKASNFHLTHEFFLQVCNNFPFSWKPIYKFFHFTLANPDFQHTTLTFNKMLGVFGKAKNVDALWDLIREMGRRRLVNDQTYRIALKALASSRELKRCVEFFHLMNGYGYGYSLVTLNRVVESLCGAKLVEEAKYIVAKLRDWIEPDGVTYKWLIFGFCDKGDLVEASVVWNMMVDEGGVVNVDALDKMVDTLFKTNRFDDAMKLFQSMRSKDIDVLGGSSYGIVIKWMCKIGKLGGARLMFQELQQRGIEVDSETLGSLVYGFVCKARVREAYLLADGIEKPNISVYHGFIKGFLKLKRAKDATNVFREMINRGCEPTMHTYIMLLQGHLGKRGRKGSDPLVNFDTIFVGGMVKAGKSLEATKYVERMLNRGQEVPRFDYNKFLHCYSNEEGVVMFEEVTKKLREVGSFDLADIFARYGEKMATRDRRRNRELRYEKGSYGAAEEHSRTEELEVER
ncbi:putative pentatricopeptide repeat-containing protein At1g26500 isoform X2 [Daucus carota subsp. sativus]|uniref:putative pentatricopeptide repeat-containing protein At1g26500 isoform X2 n=1 Tax=Daucus carota subsp. sativus TaxID=79200 RepID=UPI0007EF11A8|nr:PREDICTED: putative pentatricopeptide repeat-containing protein At1g26500 isoform X2 [Daucus carota subsp. sativus]